MLSDIMQNKGESIIPLEELDLNTINWFRGNPETPEENLLILYQDTSKDTVSYDFFKKNDIFKLDFNQLYGEISHEGGERGSFPIGDLLSSMNDLDKGRLADLFEYIGSVSKDEDDELHLDVVFIPYGVNHEKAIYQILGNYLMEHLAKLDYSLIR